MKNLFSLSSLFTCCLLVIFSFTTSCTTEEVVTPVSQISIDDNIKPRTDFSGLEIQVKKELTQRYNISTSAITSCYFHSTTSEGYGRYDYTTSMPSSGSFFVTGIIGDEIEGF